MTFLSALAPLLACGCLAAASASAQVVLRSGEGLTVEERVAHLAAREARISSRIERAIYHDPQMRAEIRRIGFAKGCEIVGRTGSEVLERHAPVLEPAIAEAITKVIPDRALAEARVISFLATPLSGYRGRVEQALEEGAAEALAAARADMRRTFLAATASLPATTDPQDNAVAPKPDIAASLGLAGNWDLDRPEQLALACAEHRISPQLRPTITTGAAQQP